MSPSKQVLVGTDWHRLPVIAHGRASTLDSQPPQSLRLDPPHCPRAQVGRSESHLLSLGFAEVKPCSPKFWEFPKVWLLPLSTNWPVLTPKLVPSNTGMAVWSIDTCRRF